MAIVWTLAYYAFVGVIMCIAGMWKYGVNAQTANKEIAMMISDGQA